LVIGLPGFQAALYLANAQALTSGVDFQHFIADFDFNVLLFFKFFGGPGNQFLDVADNLADVVGDASGRIGREGTAFISDDFKLWIPAARPRSGCHAGCITTDNQ
jgi:hypothetical protein